MNRLICSGARLICSHGTSESTVLANSQVLLCNKSVITSDNCLTGVNIFTFGTCLITGNVCTPVTTCWTNCCNLVKADNIPLVTVESSLKCSIGGTITVVDPVQDVVTVN